MRRGQQLSSLVAAALLATLGLDTPAQAAKAAKAEPIKIGAPLATAFQYGWVAERGIKLERELTDRQSQRFARAYRETGAEAVEGFRKVLLGLLDPAERTEVDKRVRSGGR